MARFFVLLATFLYVFAAGPASATQEHADPEGLYSHLIAHIFFITAMLILVFQIKRSGQQHKGWRFISLAAILFIAWNIDTFTTHVLREYIENDAFITSNGIWHRTINLSTLKAKVFYAGKILDHILLVSSCLIFMKGINEFQNTKDGINP